MDEPRRSSYYDAAGQWVFACVGSVCEAARKGRCPGHRGPVARGASRAVRLVGCLATPRAVRPRGGNARRAVRPVGQWTREPLGPVASAAGKKKPVTERDGRTRTSCGKLSRCRETDSGRTLEPEQAALVTSVVKQPAGRTRKPERAAPKNVKGNLDFLVDSGSAVHVVPPEAARWGRLRRDLEETNG